MRNQFVGDINDYYKYQTLNELARSSEVNVCWMLNPDISGQDSKHIKYYIYDELAVFLKELTKNGRRDVKEIENSPLIKVKKYFNQISDIDSNQLNGILFFDPDNGIEVKSCKKGDNKYLFFEDIKHFLSKTDILIYQHFPRVPHSDYMEMRTNEIISKTNCVTVIHFPESMVDFILIKRKIRGVKG